MCDVCVPEMEGYSPWKMSDLPAFLPAQVSQFYVGWAGSEKEERRGKEESIPVEERRRKHSAYLKMETVPTYSNVMSQV